MTETFYDKITVSDISLAYGQVEKVAKENEKLADFKTLLTTEMMKHHCDARLSEVVVKKLKMIR